MFTPKWKDEAKHLAKGARKFVHYKRDLLPADRVAEIESRRTDLLAAIKSGDRAKVDEASKQIRARLRKRAAPRKTRWLAGGERRGHVCRHRHRTRTARLLPAALPHSHRLDAADAQRHHRHAAGGKRLAVVSQAHARKSPARQNLRQDRQRPGPASGGHSGRTHRYPGLPDAALFQPCGDFLHRFQTRCVFPRQPIRACRSA